MATAPKTWSYAITAALIQTTISLGTSSPSLICGSVALLGHNQLIGRLVENPAIPAESTMLVLLQLGAHCNTMLPFNATIVVAVIHSLRHQFATNKLMLAIRSWQLVSWGLTTRVIRRLC